MDVTKAAGTETRKSAVKPKAKGRPNTGGAVVLLRRSPAAAYGYMNQLTSEATPRIAAEDRRRDGSSS